MSYKNTTTQFWENIDIPNDLSKCWFWTGNQNSQGYGRVYLNGQGFYAHRIMWELIFGPIPTGVFVCHHCDTPLCVNPLHLFLGTQADNMRDCTNKRRQEYGENHHNAKLTAPQVLKIRKRPMSISKLARYYGISRRHIRAIQQRRYWRYL